MISKKYNNIEVYLFKSFLSFNKITHFITTRYAGVSAKPFNTLNLGYKSGDSIKNIENNWAILKKALNLNSIDILTVNQVHSDKIIIIDKKLEGNFHQKIEGDAIITNIKGIFIAVLVADCVPLLLYDPVKSVIATIHAGWRGTSLEIGKKVVYRMQIRYNSNPKDIIVGIGPSIGPCCYDIRDDIVGKFIKYKDSLTYREGRYYLNLWEINKYQLLESGIDENNIEIAGLCTSCNDKIFFSYRKENPTGRFAAGVMIK